jgi:hypothetical protein
MPPMTSLPFTRPHVKIPPLLHAATLGTKPPADGPQEDKPQQPQNRPWHFSCSYFRYMPPLRIDLLKCLPGLFLAFLFA